MSTWITLAWGAKAGDLAGDAVIEARAERDQQVALLDRGHRACTCRACPACPRCWSCESGNAPRAIKVVTTGIVVRSAKAREFLGSP